MEFRSARWQLTAIELKNLMGNNPARTTPHSKKEQIVQEELEDIPVPRPIAIADTTLLKQQISQLFFIEGEFGKEASIVGDFYYFPNSASIRPRVRWLAASGIDGNAVLGEFSDKTKAEREKFNIVNQYYYGRWGDAVPLTIDTGVANVSGICTLSVPSKIVSFSIPSSTTDKLHISKESSVKVTEMANGALTISYYYPFRMTEFEPTILIHNCKNQQLKKTGSSSQTQKKTMAIDGLTGEYREVSRQISVSGMSTSADVYFSVHTTEIESKFIAKRKPEVSFGELKTPIKRSGLKSRV